MPELFLTSLVVQERAGIARINEPVRTGMPFPHGAVSTTARLFLRDPEGRHVPLQANVLMRWRDGSVKWALLEFWVTVEPHGRSDYELHLTNNVPEVATDNLSDIVWSNDAISVNTGCAVFHINSRLFKPFDRVTVNSVDVVEKETCGLSLIDADDNKFAAVINDIAVESTGPVRTTLRVCGVLGARSQSPIGGFIARLNFYRWKSFVELQLTIRNPRAAAHGGGLWDLGDEGSVYFRELTLQTTLATSSQTTIAWSTEPSTAVIGSDLSRVEIYQDSSGGQNWYSANHVNRFGRLPITFKGYRVKVDDDLIQSGDRCLPIVRLSDVERSLSGTVVEFWQNFPKAITAGDKSLRLSLFPSQFADVHELQGGEQKTHTVFLSFDAPASSSSDLNWVHARLIPFANPDWYAHTRAIPYLLPCSHEPDHPNISQMNVLVQSAIHGDDTFFLRREIIDEYGWRNFGDLYADHEAVGQTGECPRIAHYNNQYDVIYGAAVHYLRSGEPEWFRLASELARHVIDIDIYHTGEDRSAYNGGMFWHTSHYSDAATATHRTYSRSHVKPGGAHPDSGGPSSSHNYSTGLLYYYLLTGDITAYEVVHGLADWVVSMDDGSQSRFGYFDKRPTGRASCSVSRDYHGPGRGSGNSLSVLLDAWILTGKDVYRMKLEELVQRCIHPQDDILARGLEDVENRWSYTIFLQSLGKYLDFKAERGEIDFMYEYARQGLLHYARWMWTHEVPYGRVLHKVEIPTETWPAQDIR